MVQPFGNIPKLTDPGVSPAISGSSNLIQGLLRLKEQEDQNQNALTRALLGGAIDLTEQDMANKAALQKAGLEMPLNRLKTAETLQKIGEGLIQTSPDPTVGRNLIRRSQELVSDFGVTQGQGQGSGVPAISDQGGQQQPAGGSFDESGAFRFSIEKSAPQSPLERKLRADTSTAETKARQSEFEAVVSDPEFRFGIGATGVQDALRAEAQGTPLPAVDITGIPLDEGMTQAFLSNRSSFTNLTPNKRSEVVQQTPGAAAALKNYVDLGLDIINKRNTGILDRARLSAIVAADGAGFDDLRPDEEAVLTFISQVAPLVIKTAGADQGVNSISDKDRESIEKSIGSPTGPKDVFVNNFSRFAAKSYLSALRNAANVDAFTYKQIKQDLEQLTGQPFDPKDLKDIPKIAKQIKAGLAANKEANLKQTFNRMNEDSGQLGMQSQLLNDIDSIVGGQGLGQ